MVEGKIGKKKNGQTQMSVDRKLFSTKSVLARVDIRISHKHTFQIEKVLPSDFCLRREKLCVKIRMLLLSSFIKKALVLIVLHISHCPGQKWNIQTSSEINTGKVKLSAFVLWMNLIKLLHKMYEIVDHLSSALVSYTFLDLLIWIAVS